MSTAPGNLVISKNKLLNMRFFTLQPATPVAKVFSKIYDSLFKEEVKAGFNSFLVNYKKFKI